MIFIVVKLDSDMRTIIESVWSTKELAQSAIEYYRNDPNGGWTKSYTIIERELNKVTNK